MGNAYRKNKAYNLGHKLDTRAPNHNVNDHIHTGGRV